MQMTGEQAIAAPRERVWAALNDPEVLRRCIPGCESLTREADDRLAAVAQVRIGPIGARFKGAVTLSELEPLNGYVITGSGQGGIAGNARGNARVRLSDDGGGTLVSYTVEAEVGGRMAQLGGPVIDATARQMAGKFFETFAEVVTGAAPAQVGSVSSSTTTAPAATVTRTPWPMLAALVLGGLGGYALGQNGIAPAWALITALVALGGVVLGRMSR